MNLINLLNSSPFILTEGSVIERIRRDSDLELNPFISNSAFVYDSDGAEILREIYRQYIDIGQKYNLPILILTPTWRANKERIQKSGYSHTDVNGDNFRFLNEIRKEYGVYSKNILIGGLIGCANDAYKPEESLSAEEAEEFHKYQLEHLVRSGVDFLIASTLPALPEAKGIAKAMSKCNIPYILSFVIRKDGTLLDGKPLSDVIRVIDETTNPNPAFYMVNCVHPSVLNSTFESLSSSSDLLELRLLGIQANTSCKSPEELDGMEILDTESPDSFSKAMVNLHTQYKTKVLGGCCGTDNTHIEEIARQYLKSF